MFKDVIKKYFNEKNILSIKEYGRGHINKTYLITFPEKKYILQQINSTVFKNPWGVMKNIEMVTEHLKRKAIFEGKNPNRVVLNIIRTVQNQDIVTIGSNFFRCYEFIEGGKTFEEVSSPEIYYEVGRAVGEFQRLLMDFPIETLFETIPDFHNTPKRFNDFKEIVEIDPANRVESCQPEIDFIYKRENVMSIITDMLEDKTIPYRVTHNDTKLNNVMICEHNQKSLCLIDFDTVMPGSVLYDYGDALRIGASLAAEDETDLDKVKIDFNLFESFTKGFLSEAKDILNEAELENLVNGYKIIALELGMRFLHDHIAGDHYFRVHRINHNLERARNQLRLVEEIEKNQEKLEKIVLKHIKIS
ncbi:MAG: aminoglycoside phosphotransferase family protein [Erysipelotrichales bacterium]|nr:aminoglycoside phosphotransferase family protein [Erysipelotrichales bacterium]